MDLDVGYSVQVPQNNLLTLPTELIVYILSFLTCASDLVKLRCVSRMLRGVCETPSLWRQFIWPHFHTREYHCVKSVLKSYGQHIKYLSFPHHVTPYKLTPMLKHCNNLVKLRLSTIKLSCNQLGQAIQSMEKLQVLDVLWKGQIPPLLVICNKLKELTIRLECLNLNEALGNWATQGFIPEALNIFDSHIYYKEIAQQWLSLNSTSPTTHTSYLNVYRYHKVLMDLSPLLPDFQLQFGQSCTLPFVRPSKCGLLGLELDLLLLTNCVSERKALCKGMVRKTSHDDIINNHLNSDIDSLTLLTHFDASRCQLYSGHLEQLAMTCPNLMELNLRGNVECLKRLQGLRMISVCCQELRGINLSFISLENVENQVQLWDILANLKLLYLAIELCALIPNKVDEQTKGAIVALYQKCSHLKALEFGGWCNRNPTHGELLLLSNFTSLMHLSVNFSFPTEIFNRCKQLKYFICSDWFDSSRTFVLNCNLEQLHIDHDSVDIPDTFMESISAHGRLVHVVMKVNSVTGDGVVALIESSAQLMTCHIVACRIIASECQKRVRLKLRNFKTSLKKIYSNRKLFYCGCYSLARSRHSSYRITLQNTELIPLFD